MSDHAYDFEAGGPAGRFEVTGRPGYWVLKLYDHKDEAVYTQSGTTMQDYSSLIDAGFDFVMSKHA